MTKKNILFLSSGIISAAILIADYIGNYQLCGGEYWNDCVDILAGIELVLSSFLPLFFFSLVTYFMKEEVFQSWYEFVRIYIPFSIILVLLAPSYRSNWMSIYEKGTAAFFAVVSFTIVSIVIILVALLRSRSKMTK